MFKNKVFNLLISLMLVFGVYSTVEAYGGSYNGMMGNNYNNQMYDNNGKWNSGGYGMMGYNGNNGYGGYGMMGNGGMMGMMMGSGGYGMMGGYGSGINNNADYSLSALGMTEDQVKQMVVELVQKQFGPDHQVADIFIFANSPYYIIVEEKGSRQGAFELLFDPYQKVVYPDYGPNMVWNTKYGMSNIMGWSKPDSSNMLDSQQVLEQARKFAQGNGFAIMGQGHQFPGYFTFRTEENGKVSGMLSVNAYTGQVWYHNWHGNLTDVIELDKQ